MSNAPHPPPSPLAPPPARKKSGAGCLVLLLLSSVGGLLVTGAAAGLFLFYRQSASSYQEPVKRSFKDEISSLKVELTDGAQRTLTGKVKAPSGTWFQSATEQYPLTHTQETSYGAPEYVLSFDVSKATCGKKHKVKVRAEHYSYKPITLSASFTRQPSLQAAQASYGSQRYDLSCECMDCAGTFDPKEGLKMKVPKGASVTLAGMSVPVSKGEGKLKVDAAALAMEQPYGGALALPLVLTTAQKKKLSATLALPGNDDDLTRRLRAVPGKGLAFPSEDGQGLLLAFAAGATQGTKYGAGRRTKDIDKVALGSSKYSSKRCGVYQHAGGSFILSVNAAPSGRGYHPVHLPHCVGEGVAPSGWLL
jgi:hypothetical protein